MNEGVSETVMAPVATPTPRRSKAAPRVEHLTPRERLARGAALRAQVLLTSHAELGPDRPGRDPVALLQAQDASRVPELVPIRYGRMLASPFTFFRGAARVMANDLAVTPRSGIVTQLCGDAHLSNFGLFASPERRLVFDINDFDETLPGPWEWDVKRLAASLEIAGRDNGFSAKQRRKVVGATVARYRIAMHRFAGMRDIDVWYLHADAEGIQEQMSGDLDAKRKKMLAKTFEKARTHDSMQALGKLTSVVDGTPRITADPPLIVPLADLLTGTEFEQMRQRFHSLLRSYRRTLQSDRRVLLERYRFADMARKVVGVGSVGTRCWVMLLVGRDSEDPLFLQIKEAGPSVLAEHLSKSDFANEAHRVVAGQRLMQEVSDIFLGWLRTTGVDGVQRDFYFRQLKDWKGSAPVEALVPKGMRLYGELCGWTLARAHARSGDRIAIAGYTGDTDEFDVAVAEFAEKYADRNERDHRALADAVAAGTVTAQSGL